MDPLRNGHGPQWVHGPLVGNPRARCMPLLIGEWLGYDETTLAIGLGFTCHLVAMISNYLDIPLRYPMLHRGSRSLIYDHIMDKLTDSERELVFYCVCIRHTDICFCCSAFVQFVVYDSLFTRDSRNCYSAS